jgi:hypothetical protein
LLHLLAHISIFNHCLSITHVCCAVIICKLIKDVFFWLIDLTWLGARDDAFCVEKCWSIYAIIWN